MWRRRWVATCLTGMLFLGLDSSWAGDDDEESEQPPRSAVVVSATPVPQNGNDGTTSKEGLVAETEVYLLIPEDFALRFNAFLETLPPVPSPSSGGGGITWGGPDLLVWLSDLPQQLYFTDQVGEIQSSFAISSPGGGSLENLTFDPGCLTVWSYDASASTYYEFDLTGIPTGGTLANPSDEGSGAVGGGIAYWSGEDGFLLAHGSLADGIVTTISVVDRDGEPLGLEIDLTPLQSTEIALDVVTQGTTGTPSIYLIDGTADMLYEIEMVPYREHELTEEIAPGPLAPGDRFGTDVALRSELMAIGVPNRDLNRGALMARVLGTGVSEFLENPGGSPGDHLGASVTVSNNRVAAGAPGRAMDTGAVDVFAFVGGAWAGPNELMADDGTAGDLFGTSVEMLANATLLVVGAPGADNDQGAVYIFSRTGAVWTQDARLTASGGAPGDAFGTSVDIQSDPIGLTRVAVGAPGADVGAGAVYLFELPPGAIDWAEKDILTASDAQPLDEFGAALELRASELLIGAPGRETQTGGAYLFRQIGTSHVERRRFTVGVASPGDRYGSDVALESVGIAALAGPAANISGVPSGAVAVFGRRGPVWRRIALIPGDDPSAGDQFGHAVSVHGCRLLVGAPGTDESGMNAGSAEVYVIGTDCNENGTSDICEIDSGLAPDCNFNRVIDTCELVVPPTDCRPRFLRADTNDNGGVEIADAIQLLTHLFVTPGMGCLAAGDANDTGVLDIADAVWLLSFLFVSGAPPEEPYPECNIDPTEDLSCEVYASCP